MLLIALIDLLGKNNFTKADSSSATKEKPGE
jgi:hypothetical protein